jgi:hypothetical protein
VIEYAADLFSAADIAALALQFEEILAQVTTAGPEGILLVDLRLGPDAATAAAGETLAIELQL